MFTIPRAPDEGLQPKPEKSGRSNRRILLWVILFIALTPVAGFVGLYIYLAIGWQDSMPRGPLPNRADWPIIVREWLDEMKAAGIDTSLTEAYLIKGMPGDYAKTIMLRMDDDPQTMDFLRRKLALQPIPPSRFDLMMMQSKHNVPDQWWASSDPSVQYSANIRALSGEEADQYVVARDPKQEKIFVHYYFNF